ncbi:MAG: aminopeptidase P family protein [Treponema sp.]|nr:aminopeptidase P family protein [Treponema sp.]
MIDLDKIQKAIREEKLDGWLFCNFRHRDALSDAVLERPSGLTNSRLWFYAVPSEGEPFGLTQAIETDHLDGLPGTKNTYISRKDLEALLAPLAGKRWGAHFSETLSAVSFLDAGTASFLEKAGLVLVPAEALVQRFISLLDSGGVASHERAAAGLYRIVEKVWDIVRSSYAQKKELYEGDLRRAMEEEFVRLGLVRDHPPLAAAGPHSANPHYDFAGQGALVKEGDIIQLDLWAKENGPRSIYADISWAGVYAEKIPEDAEKIFADLVSARDKTFAFIERELSSGRKLSGAEVDAYTRSLLVAGGYEKAIKHRTGHGIDTECHGSGVNIDSVEFPDSRFLLDGSCFSLEPGIYLDRYGFRTELDVYIAGGKPRYYGRLQTSLLHC